MITPPQLLEQEVLHNNKEIFLRIVKELQNADFEILIANSWFTDDELFEIVKQKTREGVSVKLIIADNQENFKLDFDDLVALGASVTKIKNVGYGIMHQKFCVIDKRIALHGSYNWSINARKNNHESIIVTNHPGTVESLIINFNDINRKALGQDGDDNIDIVEEDLTAESKIEKHTAKDHAISEFTKVLDSMISAEIGNFDRSILRRQGYERSKFNNGDHQVLTKSLDTVYSVFINDIDVVEDKKRRLNTKIDEQEIKSITTFEENLSLQLQTAEEEAENEKLNAKNRLINLRSDSDKNKQNIDNFKNNRIPFHEKVINEIKEKIRNAQRDFIKPKFKWYEFVPVLFANLCLTTYIFIFYSSACYILLFAVEDSKISREAGLNKAPDIFNANALSLTLEKGGTGVLFIFLFVSIPLFCALIRLFTKNKWIIIPMFIIGIAFIDLAIAYKVSAAIHQIKYDEGDTNEIWKARMAFSDPNFYLVFLLGGLGLLMLKFAFEKMISIFEERNPDIATLKNNLLIKQMNEDIKSEEEKILSIKGEIYTIEAQNIDLIAQYKIIETKLENIPSKLNMLKEIKKADLIIGKQHIKDIATIYKSHIDNDRVPISIDSLNDRINVFLEGWNDYLHEEYAILKAIEKSKEAFDTAVNWQSEKARTSQIDKRVIV